MNKKIFQIYITDDNSKISDKIYNRTKKLKDLYPDWEYELLDDTACRDFLKKYYEPNVLKAYEMLLINAFKADLVRYCLLYTFGGLYCDVGIYPEYKVEGDRPIFTYNGPSYENNYTDTIDQGFLYFPEPNEPFLLELINQSTTNILNKIRGTHPLDITGPTMVGKKKFNYAHFKLAFTKELGPITGENRKAAFLDDKILFKYKNRVGASLSKQGCSGTNNYCLMWSENKIYKDC